MSDIDKLVKDWTWRNGTFRSHDTIIVDYVHSRDLYTPLEKYSIWATWVIFMSFFSYYYCPPPWILKSTNKSRWFKKFIAIEGDLECLDNRMFRRDSAVQEACHGEGVPPQSFTPSCSKFEWSKLLNSIIDQSIACTGVLLRSLLVCKSMGGINGWYGVFCCDSASTVPRSAKTFCDYIQYRRVRA